MASPIGRGGRAQYFRYLSRQFPVGRDVVNLAGLPEKFGDAEGFIFGNGLGNSFISDA
jgi:hypothetical protein